MQKYEMYPRNQIKTIDKNRKITADSFVITTSPVPCSHLLRHFLKEFDLR